MNVHAPGSPGATGDSGLTVRDLAVGYGPVAALRGISLRVPRGAVVAVLGGNGAGKSTLLRAISGTLRFHRGGIASGDVTFDGERISGVEPSGVVARGVVQVPEGRRIFARMTVEENLRAGALSVRDRGANTRARERVLGLFPILAERSRQRAGLMSGGEQQMLAIGRALMAAPRLLLLDEPTLGLAPIMAARIAETIQEINAQGTSVLLVEQNVATALALASHAYVLEVGEVALSGAARDLAGDDEVRRRYLGIGPDADGGTSAQGTPDAPAERRTLTRWSA
ncbi:ABC transporter ATP-binding protein [Microtetraspora sp. AC03309]|uniref:ABC transporter ATP-binding protein n=1 Tax=Microtetraspora sp. AC03309 TaxID=2779376 RepID=UPI001E3B10C2|nr:ABC transporter ATP-binding protein [Microtetraspora sp. AC03309]MCC5575490.1 ABC transporter ATP-binding protein [Microtetraspora sp. AC03309]